MATISNSRCISGEELHLLPEFLVQAGRSDLVYNLFYKSARLARRDEPEVYARYAFQRLSEFTAICRNNQQYIDKVIFTSSSSVYGSSALGVESDQCEITNLYSSLKFASELFLREHLFDTSIRLVIARVFNMYGGVDEFSVISKIANAISKGLEFRVSNRGSSVRDYIHISDVVEIYRRLISSSFSGVINVATGAGLSLIDVIEKAEIAFDRRLRVACVASNEIERSIACVDKLLSVVGPINFYSVDQYFKEKSIANYGRDFS
jgi:UDP-glucose 4-epimerase